jgi:hypothetical protein
MYINNFTYKQKHVCSECKNLNICKFTTDMRKTQEEVTKISSSITLSPIKAEVTCANFETKNNNNYNIR